MNVANNEVSLLTARQREGRAEGQPRRREATVGRKPMAKRWPDEQEPYEANAWGEEANISKARSLYGRRVRRCGRHKRESRCALPGEAWGHAHEGYRRWKAA